jgi:hypothetical protein
MTEKISQRIEVIERICHCGYCKFCKNSDGIKYFQVYVDGKPVVAGKTKEKALEEYDAFVERMSEREWEHNVGLDTHYGDCD